jgi:hypothetical protein
VRKEVCCVALKWTRKIQFGKKTSDVSLPKPIAQHLRETGVKSVEVSLGEGGRIVLTPA